MFYKYSVVSRMKEVSESTSVRSQSLKGDSFTVKVSVGLRPKVSHRYNFF